MAYSYVSAGTALSQVHDANNMHASTAVQPPRQHSTDTLSCSPHALDTVMSSLQQRYIPGMSLVHRVSILKLWGQAALHIYATACPQLAY